MRGGRRVVVTGLGAVSPLGPDLESTWQGLVAGRSGIRRIRRFDPAELPCQVAGEVDGFDVGDLPQPLPPGELSRRAKMALAAVREAMAQAHLGPGVSDPDRCGLSLAPGENVGDGLDESIGALTPAGHLPDSPQRRALDLGWARRVSAGAIVGQVAHAFGLRGPRATTLTACAAGSDAISNGARAIQFGEADVMVAGGSDARVFPISLGVYTLLGATCRAFNDEPERASRPFDSDRAGFVLGEGAAIAVLESLEHARARGATILAEVLGASSTNDASKATAPHPQDLGAIGAVRGCLDDAGIEPRELDYVNAHGTSTPVNDLHESNTLLAALGDRATTVPVGSFKSMIGHLFAAAGAVEFVGTVKALREGVLPPSINVDNQDARIPLRVLREGPLHGSFRTALSNSFGFGGHNACIIVRRWDA